MAIYISSHHPRRVRAPVLRRSPTAETVHHPVCFLLPYLIDVKVIGSVAACVLSSNLIVRLPVLRTRVSSPVVTIAVAAVAANAGWLPPTHPIYDAIITDLLPIATSLFIFNADLRRIAIIGRTGVAFLVGAFGTVVGSITAYFLLRPVLPDIARLSGIFSATYIGGTVNYLSVARALGLSASPTLIAAGLAVDNVLMVIYLSVLFGLSGRKQSQSQIKVVATPSMSSSVRALPAAFLAALIATAMWALSFHVSLLLRLPNALTGVPVVAILTALASTLLPGVFLPLAKAATPLANGIFSLFFVSVGAAADISQLSRLSGYVIIFAAVILIVHGLILLAIGRYVLKIPTAELLVASNANIGGAGTAAAFASEKGWQQLVLPAVLTGTLGYIVATPIGILLATILKT